MGCLKHKRRSSGISEPDASFQPPTRRRNMKQETLLQIPSCTLHLMEAGESVELARGDFTLFRVADQDDQEEDSCLSLATVISIAGGEVQWPLTKDEPVVKLDDVHYLFSLPMKEGDPLSYGITFSQEYRQRLSPLDAFLGEHCCFSAGKVGGGGGGGLKWEEFAPKVEDYNGVLGRAIAGGTGHIVRGIFKCSNAYTNQCRYSKEVR
ncbi:Senescence/dehydration-associated protein At4g35985, chloroplastic [Linum grandiflorum]